MRLLVAAALLATTATAARADEPTITAEIQPMMLVATFIDAQVEARVAPHVGLAAIAGFGAPVFGATIKELGGQANVYLQHEFTGLHVGAEVKYLWVDANWIFAQSSGDNRTLGAYLGWKWVARSGLSAVLQVGVGQLHDPQAKDMPVNQIIPVANLYGGWSF